MCLTPGSARGGSADGRPQPGRLASDLGTLALVVLGLLAWELRWVLLVLFGAVVLAVALDVPVQVLMRRTPLQRPQALVVVVGLLICRVGWLFAVARIAQQVATP